MAFFTRIFWNLAKFFEQSRWSKTAVTAFVIFFGVFAVSGKALARDRALLEKLAGLIAEFNLYIAGFIGGLITIVLEKLLIPIMQYNEFATSPVVAMGWVLVRDIMNMFFIVILLIIAFGTIFGISKIKWQQQVPRLLFVAVLINFSKTITGLLIDFAQVIMMTFVNALKDIAGGNFVDLFQLKDILAFTTRGDVGREQFFSGNVTDSFAIFASSCLAVGLLLAVLAVCLIMLTVFLYRIVTLWVLTIMSPLAFFMLGAKDVVGPASKYYAEWWSKLTAAASIGPILAFFLWLALAAAGQGALAEGFGVPPSESEQTGFITKIFTGNTIMPFVIGIAILLAGLEIAQTTAGSIGGAAGKAMGERFGRAQMAARGAMAAPAALYAKGARSALRRPVRGAAGVAGTLLSSTGAGIAKKIPLVGGMLGAIPAAAGVAISRSVKKSKSADKDKAHQSNEGMSDDDLNQYVRSTKGATLLPGQKEKRRDAMLRLLSSPKYRKDSSLADQKDLMRDIAKDKDDLSTEEKELVDTKILPKAVHLSGAWEGEADGSDEEKEKIKKYMSEHGTEARQIESRAFGDAGVRQAAEETNVGRDRNGNLIKLTSAVAQGDHGTEKRDVWEKAASTDVAEKERKISAASSKNDIPEIIKILKEMHAGEAALMSPGTLSANNYEVGRLILGEGDSAKLASMGAVPALRQELVESSDVEKNEIRATPGLTPDVEANLLAQVNNSLMRATSDANFAHGLVVDPTGATPPSFNTPNGEQTFSKAVAKDATIINNITINNAMSQKGYDNNVARAALQNMPVKNIEDYFKKYLSRDTDAGTKTDIERMFRELNFALVKNMAALGTHGTDLDNTFRQIRRVMGPKLK